MNESIVEIIKRHEGVVPHLYLDLVGKITCGVGFLVSSIQDLKEYHWTDYELAEDDYHHLSQLMKVYGANFNRAASFYAKVCNARLVSPDSNVERKLRRFERELAKGGLVVSGLPVPAQNVVLDMTYQLGSAGLLIGFPSFVRAIKARDWETAAKESGVKQAGMARRVWRTTTLLQLATDERAAVTRCPECGQHRPVGQKNK